MGGKMRGGAAEAPCLMTLVERCGRTVASFDCKGCARESDLSSAACWKGVTSAIAQASSLDSIVLAGHVETEYTGRGLEHLEMMRRASASARGFSSRAAPSDSKACAACALNPSRLFGGCADGLAAGIREGHAAVSKAETALMAGLPAKSCEGCVRASEKDVAYLRAEHSAVCRAIMREAYGIVGGSL
jgi:hypothetical protein